MNLPNKLTVARLILTFIFVGILSTEFPNSHTIAAILFAIAAITDFFDGYLARKHNLITNFGKLMDPLADKVLLGAGFILLSEMGLIPGWVVVIIFAREFFVTGLRLVASSAGHVLPAEKIGKQKTIWQIVCVSYFLVYLASDEFLFRWIRGLFEWHPTSIAVTGQILIGIAFILTLISGLSYLWKNRSLLSDC